jgi:HAD superfamily hydrolase (TIGR01509 family)
MKYKAVLFDLDGTLVDAVRLHEEAFIESVKEHTGIEISSNFHDNYLNGLSTKKKLRILEDISVDYYDKIFIRKQELTLKFIVEQIKEDKSKIELMDKLKQEGYRIACVTNSIRASAELLLQYVGVSSYIELLVSNEDVEKPKPSAEGYLKAISHFELEPTDCLVVEDNDFGVRAANNAGCSVYRVSNPQDVSWDNIKSQL